ncbi:hypothetical protein V499_00225 [Pseudogymnoascus sp. VKM F-103]|nr:hypothetical protein V499_00225 [Pseudogymnoascus sp. VKM F-103]
MFPNSNTKESRMDKITLARLCRASKMLCSFAQPVLFHYYATGNLARSVRTDFQEYNRSWDVEYWNFEDDKLPAFLRSLITRPDLALCVKSLQLQGFGDQDLCSPELMRLLFNAGNALNFKPPAGWRWKGWAEEPEDWSDYEPPTNRTYIVSYENFHPDFLDFHDWLRALAIALTPRTEMLMYICEGLSELDSFKETKTVLPALKTLAVRGANDEDYFLSSIHPLLTVAPNLETLYALDCNGVKNSPSRYSLVAKGDMWIENLAVNKVHKLVLDEIPPAVFEKLIERFVQLEDLEYYIYSWANYPNIMQAISPTKGRLRRLCFGYLPPPAPGHYESRLPDNDYATITSLQEFTQLEELVIDQALLYRKSDGPKGTILVTLLPSIRRIHLTYVYKSMYEDLMSLAHEAPRSFPNLRSLKIGLSSPIPPNRIAEIEKMKAVESTFVSMGVHVSWAEDLKGPFLYTAIPGGAPGLTVTHVPASSGVWE